MRKILLAFAIIFGATQAQAQVYSSLETPQEMPAGWIGYYVQDLSKCRDDTYLEGVSIERKGLHFYEAAALAQRIVWVNDDEELVMYALLGGEGMVGPATYRIRRSANGKSITFFGGESAADENAAGEVLLRCP